MVSVPEALNAPTPLDPALALTADRREAERYAAASIAPATLRAYGADWRAWVSYAGTHGVEVMPALPEDVAAFLAREASRGRKAATVTRRAAAVATAHRAAG